jgi:hypothetical protein
MHADVLDLRFVIFMIIFRIVYMPVYFNSLAMFLPGDAMLILQRHRAIARTALHTALHRTRVNNGSSATYIQLESDDAFVLLSIMNERLLLSMYISQTCPATPSPPMPSLPHPKHTGCNGAC